VADVDPSIPVIFLDTSWLFEDAGLSRYADAVLACATFAPSSRSMRSCRLEDPDRELWFSDPDACCRIRKVEPLARALKPFSAWINAQAFPGRRAGGYPRRRGRRREAEIQPVCQCVARRDRGDLPAFETAAASIDRIGLSLSRVYALLESKCARRRRTRRPLARQGQDRVRHPHHEDFLEAKLAGSAAFLGHRRCGAANNEMRFR
jgi:hypothetical protein